MNRGDVVWVDLDIQYGREVKKTRPAIIVSEDLFNNDPDYPFFILVPLTSTLKRQTGFWARVRGPRGTWNTALCDQVKSVDRGRVVRETKGKLSDGDMEAVDAGLRVVLGL